MLTADVALADAEVVSTGSGVALANVDGEVILGDAEAGDAELAEAVPAEPGEIR